MTIPGRRLLAAEMIAVVMALAGCQSTSDDVTPSVADRSVAPSASTQPSAEASASSTNADEPVETSVFDLEVGDCFSAEGDSVESVMVVDCEQSHTYEAFFVFDHEAGPDEEYPGDDAMLDYADEACQPPFEEFVGTDYESSIWYITSVTPSAETWADGDREIICTLDQQDADGEAIEVTGTAEGSAE